MSDTDPDLDRLQDLLNAIPVERDGMTVAELDGYVAALIVCPEVILADGRTSAENCRGGSRVLYDQRMIASRRRLLDSRKVRYSPTTSLGREHWLKVRRAVKFIRKIVKVATYGLAAREERRTHGRRGRCQIGNC